ncbi:extracellular superoxide dismutase [Platysternon megacephalum]|uniref:Extracellular superoxide dismutase n=1 Tax=Platysternon megacephalum TaxID=55544 RepID=A0A4D9F3Y1_9SAUR|nr:extracellular superoxide dismutase [Platysternon megacephalum]
MLCLSPRNKSLSVRLLQGWDGVQKGNPEEVSQERLSGQQMAQTVEHRPRGKGENPIHPVGCLKPLENACSGTILSWPQGDGLGHLTGLFHTAQVGPKGIS